MLIGHAGLGDRHISSDLKLLQCHGLTVLVSGKGSALNTIKRRLGDDTDRGWEGCLSRACLEKIFKPVGTSRRQSGAAGILVRSKTFETKVSV